MPWLNGKYVDGATSNYDIRPFDWDHHKKVVQQHKEVDESLAALGELATDICIEYPGGLKCTRSYRWYDKKSHKWKTRDEPTRWTTKEELGISYPILSSTGND